MTADLTAYDKVLRDLVRDALFKKYGIDPDAPAKYRKVPLTDEQEAENEAWRERASLADHQLKSGIEALVAVVEATFNVEVTHDEDGEYCVSDDWDDAPHHHTWVPV
jgi:hypothetical protein